MATLREYYNNDFNRLGNVFDTFHLTGVAGSTSLNLDAPVRLHYDFDSNAKFISCFLSSTGHPLECCIALIHSLDKFLAIGSRIEISSGFVGERPVTSSSLRFSGSVFLYCEDELTAPELDRLYYEARANGLSIRFRGPAYAGTRARQAGSRDNRATDCG